MYDKKASLPIKKLILIAMSVAMLYCCTPQSAITAQQRRDRSSYTASSTLWRAMRYHFALSHHTERKEVQQQIQWLQRNKAYLNKILANAAPYMVYIYAQTSKQHLPAELALIPVVESEYNPFAYSHAGANGLWQLMPGTATGFGLTINWWYDGRRDVSASTKTALNYFCYLHHYFDNNWLLAIAAYDSGEGTVLNAFRHQSIIQPHPSFWDLNLPHETQQYIPKLLAIAAIIQNPHHYGIVLPDIKHLPYLTEITLHKQIDFKQAAKLAHMSINELRRYNPGFRRFATTPNTDYTLLLPVAKMKQFKTALRNLPDEKRVTWRHHQVRHGDTLNKIAHQYHTTVKVIKTVNHLQQNMIRNKQKLLIPMHAKHIDHTPHTTCTIKALAEDKLPGPRRLIYTVKTGDNLEKIARHYRLKASQIRFWNNLGSSSRQALTPGLTLTIWKRTRHSRFQPYLKTAHYVVKPGDSLSKIAHSRHTHTHTLKQLNHLNSDRLQIGQALRVPLAIKS